MKNVFITLTFLLLFIVQTAWCADGEATSNLTSTDGAITDDLSDVTVAYCWFEFDPMEDITVYELAKAMSCEMDMEPLNPKTPYLYHMNYLGIKKYAYDCVNDLPEKIKRHFRSECH